MIFLPKGLQKSYFLFFLMIFSTTINAQVTIGSGIPPEKGALLDLKEQIANSDDVTASKGLLLPRVKLEARRSLAPIISDIEPDITDLKRSHIGLMVYNLGTTSFLVEDPLEILKPGIYTWDGDQWTMYIDNTHSYDAKYFYMPSFNLPISSIDNGKTFNLYDEYAKQFQKQGNTMWLSSNDNLNQVSKIYAAEELDYVVAGMLNNEVVKLNSISAQGELNYDVLKTEADPEFYINIILIVK